MLLNDFKKTYKNGVDYDGNYGKQCVDLINAYAEKVLNTKKGCFFGFRYAYQIFTNFGNSEYLNSKFTKIKNSPTNFPKKSDIIFWGKDRNGVAGHCAIVEKATKNSITVFEQNYDGKGGVRTHTYNNYDNVLGWLRRTETFNFSHLKNKGFFVGLFRSNGKTSVKQLYINFDNIKLNITGTYNNLYQIQFDGDNTDYYFYK